MRKVHIIGAGMAVLALAACGEGRKAETAGEAPAAKAPPSSGAAADAPRLQSGLWRVTTTGDGPEGVMRMCLDEAVQKKMNVVGAQAAGGNCQETVMQPNPSGGWRYRSVCDYSAQGGGTSVSEGVVTGDLRTAYSSRTTVTTTGAQVQHMNRAVTVTGQGAYEGPCPDDMKAGDMIIPGGMRFNMLEMAEMASRMQASRPG